MNFRQSVGWGKNPSLVQANESSYSEMGFRDCELGLEDDEGMALVRVKAVSSSQEVMRCMVDGAVVFFFFYFFWAVGWS